MSAPWPPTLRKPKTLSFRAQSGRLRTQMDSGFARVRQRFTATSKILRVRIILISGVEWSTFWGFYDNDLAFGTIRFEYEHPAFDSAADYRFLDEPNFVLLRDHDNTAKRAWASENDWELMP